MSLRVFNLLLKHQRLDEALRNEQHRRMPDVFRIQRLKKLKLIVKDRLHKLSAGRRSKVTT
ncbi:MAG: hypothetical protein RJB22_1550 [Pseudomonadota bacterium]|jgi:hypothetical protein